MVCWSRVCSGTKKPTSIVDQLVDLMVLVGGSEIPLPFVYHSSWMVTGSMEPAATEPGDIWCRLSFSRAARIFLSTAALCAGVKGAMALVTGTKQGGDGVLYGDDMSSSCNSEIVFNTA